jgi:magnesium-protoporphyrin O-methyltransferase
MASLATDRRYTERRAWIEHYFDRTASAAWARLTSDAPVSGVRARVRRGRERTRANLLSWLPADLTGQRVLDAGCGTGLLAADLAARGAEVVAVDLSRTLTDLARERMPADLRSRITFLAGDMHDAALGDFDHVVAMDSLIHYQSPQLVAGLAAFCRRARISVSFTFAPRTPMLSVAKAVGRLFPRGDRSPSIEPIAETQVRRALAVEPAMAGWQWAADQRVTGGFYVSHGVHLRRREGRR